MHHAENGTGNESPAIHLKEAARWHEHPRHRSGADCPWRRSLCGCGEEDPHEVDSLGDSALHRASCPGQAAALLASGADINAIGARGDSPVIRHARHEQIDLVSLLVHAGADLSMGNRDGFRPIRHAARAVLWRSRKAMLTTLLRAGPTRAWSTTADGRCWRRRTPRSSEGYGPTLPRWNTQKKCWRTSRYLWVAKTPSAPRLLGS